MSEAFLENASSNIADGKQEQQLAWRRKGGGDVLAQAPSGAGGETGNHHTSIGRRSPFDNGDHDQGADIPLVQFGDGEQVSTVDG